MLEENYPQLQNLIKRDPKSYEKEFEQQYEHFLSVWDILWMGQSSSSHLEATFMFIAHCVPHYQKLANGFCNLLQSALDDVDKLANLDHSLRRTIVQAALLMKRDKLLNPVQLIPKLFRLLRIKDKVLRKLVTGSVTQELRKANHQISKQVLNFLEETILSVDGLEDDASASAAVQSLSVLIAVYGQGQWSDARPINIIANVGLNDKNVKLMLLALNFLIGGANEGSNGSDDEEDNGNDYQADQETIKKAQNRMKIAGKTKKRQSRMDRLLKKSKQEKKKNVNSTFPAIQLIYDPQRYSERLLTNLKRSVAPFEAKLVMMNALSLMIGVHQLILADFYPILLRYLQPHQRKVTKVLCYCAQASHPALPGDLLATTIKAIAFNFVADHCATPVIAAGLNAIRECLARCPSAVDETLLRDLVQYKGYKDKSVMMAARSLIGLYRKVSPELLHQKDRGRPAEEASAEHSDQSDLSQSDESDSEDVLTKSQSHLLSIEDLEKLGQLNDSHYKTVPTNLESILDVSTRLKMSKEERRSVVKAGKESFAKFGAAAKTAQHRASGKSMSNKVKRRGKLVSMLKRSKAGLYGGKKDVKKRRN